MSESCTLCKQKNLNNSLRIHWIDIAKGLAILCVFLGHTQSTPSAVSNYIYLFHMPVFFLLSGYCFSNRRKFVDFIVNKARTLLVPVLTLGMGGSLIVALLLHFVKHEGFPWQSVFLYPLIQYGDKDLLWYLPTLFVAMLLFYAITHLCKEKWLLIIIFSFILGLSSYFIIKHVDIIVPWHIDTALISLPFLAIGYVLKKKEFADKLKNIWIFFALIAVCFGIGKVNMHFFGGVSMHGNLYGNIALFYISAIAGSLMIISISQIISANRSLEFLGRNSLIFYAFEPIQYFANYILKNVFTSITYSSNLFPRIGITLIAILFIALCYSILAIIINKFFPWLTGKKERCGHERSN